jgi:hypothetical protein
LATYQQPIGLTRHFGRIANYVTGPTIQPNSTYNTSIPIFNGATSLSGSGNTITFSSATDGTASLVDLNNGLYSQSLHFTWTQATDSSITFTLDNGLQATMQFIKAINGGYEVVYTLPDPTYGTLSYVTDFVTSTPSIITPAQIPGTYQFVSTDGVTLNQVSLHADGTVSGLVGGYWFQDTNGDVVSYECYDLTGNPITSYSGCLASFNNLTNFSFAHVRRLRFMDPVGNTYQVKYDADAYGATFGLTSNMYNTVSWTYRFTRIGN